MKNTAEEEVKLEEEEIDIDLDDPEVGNAAVMIQAGFRGHQTRKAMKNKEAKVEQEVKQEEEEIDIDLNDPEVGNAAVKIQASFRGHQTRKGMKNKEEKVEEQPSPEEEEIDIDLNDPEVGNAAVKIQAGFRGHQTRKAMKNKDDKEEETPPQEEEEIDIDLNDPEVGNAAVKIQAGFRGHQTRKAMKNKDTEEIDGATEELKQEEEEIDIDLNDPEVGNAAVKIQASFRGHQTRKGMKNKEEKVQEETPPEEEIDIDLNDPEVGNAAVKIQAGFRGHQTRKAMKNKDTEEIDGATEELKQEEEEIDIDLNDPEVGNAAVKIQASFRGHQTRKGMKNKEEKVEEVPPPEEEIDIDLNDPEVGNAAVKIQAGFRGHQTRKAMKNEGNKEIDGDTVEQKQEEEEIDIDLNDPEVGNAAVKIQAGFRGHQTRKAMKNKEGANEEQVETEAKVEEEEIDIDLNDPDVGNAAVKIQAGFRGHQTRKAMKNKGADETTINETQPAPEEEEIDIDLNDPDVGNAAVKIQAGFRGHQTRKAMKTKKEEPEHIKETQVQEEEEIDIDLNDPEVGNAAVKIQAGFRGHQTRKAMKNQEVEQTENNEGHAQDQEDEIDIDLNDPDVGNAAVKIQAGFRGHQTRKAMKNKEVVKDDQAEEQSPAAEEEEIDIDLNDPEVGNAAVKIQAGFRGHQTRKSMKNKGETTVEETKSATKQQEEEEIDIDLNDPEVGNAAVKIQAGFRGHQTRKAMKNKDADDLPAEEGPTKQEDEEIDIDLNDPEVGNAAVKIQAGFRGHQTRKAMKNKDQAEEEAAEEAKETEEEIDIDLNDPEVGNAAVKIQAGFRGHQTRKAIKNKDNAEESQGEVEKEGNEKNQEEEEIDIDLEDPDVANAATKIQAGFRGHQARKEVQKKKEEKKPAEESETANDEEIDIDLDDPEVGAAATKIQAGFRGLQSRKEVKKMKEEKEGKAESLTENEAVIDKETVEEIDIDLNDPDVEQAATKIQAGFKGMKARKEVAKKKEEMLCGDPKNDIQEIVSEEVTNDGKIVEDPPGEDNQSIPDNLDLEDWSENIAAVGAIPFKTHDTNLASIVETSKTGLAADLKTNDYSNNRSEESVETIPITVYLSDNDRSSKVISIFLSEKQIDAAKTLISKCHLNNLKPEYLEINPSGEIPAIIYDKNNVVSGEKRIVAFIEEKFSDHSNPLMIPCSTSTSDYQSFLLMSVKLEGINLEAIETGLSKDRESIIIKLQDQLDQMEKIKGRYYIYNIY